MLNPSWLKTFTTLVEVGHFTLTADKLFMTQPGVSQHIKKLEDACKEALLIREKKTFVLTEKGRLVYEYAKRLETNEQLLFEQLAFDDPYSGDCSIACSGAVALLLYPSLLELQVKHPALKVKLKAAPNRQILNEIKLEAIDQGIITDSPNYNLFDAKELAHEELCLVVPQNTEFNGDKKQALMELGLIDHPDAEHYLSLYFAQSEEQDLKQLEFADLPVVGSINQISQILEPISKGIGFTVLPKSAIDTFHSKQNVKIIKPQRPVIETLYLVKKRNRTLPARYDLFNAIIENAWEYEV